jgi:hypothetical protein
MSARERAEREQARDLVGIAAGRLASVRAALQAATSRGAGARDIERLTAAERDDARALTKTKALEADVRRRLTEAAAQVAAPIEAIGTLDGRVPVAFLPVRVETRFRPGAGSPSERSHGELLVRIYPDTILADQHEPLLTVNEVEAGRDYWRRAFGLRGAPEQDPERDAWTALLNEATEPRAAWIVERTTPLNLGDRGSGVEPVLPDLDVRPEGWHRAPEARGLPERWIVTAFRGERRVRAVSGPVREGLALTLRLSGDDEANPGDAVDLSGDGLAVDPELAWVYDFEEAVAAGMGVRVPLAPSDMADGFDLLLVAGVRTGEEAGEQADELGRLLDAHRFSDGLSFLPQGTKTNNTSERPSDFPPADPAGATSFPVRRGPAQATPGTDGARVAATLGIGTAPLDHVPGAGRDEQTAAMAMADALWPGTIGYFLDQLMAPRISPAGIGSVRAWVRDWVRARGPLPAFAVGEVPYGILPVADTDNWGRVVAEDVPRRLPELLRRVGTSLPAGAAPHVGRTIDPDSDLVQVLAIDASTQTVRVRRSLGYDAIWNVLTFGGADLDAWERAQRQTADLALARLGESADTFDPRVLYLSHAFRADEFAGPLVTDDPLSETEPLTFDYIAWLSEASPAALRDQAAPPTDEPVTALLYLMLRHALLAEYDRAARRVLHIRKVALQLEDREPELVEIVQTSTRRGTGVPPPQRTAWDRFDLQVDDVSRQHTVGEFLTRTSAGGPAVPADVRPVVADLTVYRQRLKALVGLPTAELHRLFTETLDIASHRLDAWLTSLATRRLVSMREQVPDGIWLGCYAWVHDLRPDPMLGARDVTTPDGTTAAARTDSDGYLYAPSMLHGATAAVLRSAYLARSGPDQEPYTVGLDSRRVRVALGLLDGVRDSQPLGAVLGHRFERGLHDRGQDRFIDTFRGLFPQVANKVEDSGEPAEAVAARNIVDGLALLRAWQTGAIPFGSGELPGGGARRDAIEAELRGLDDATDALSDLLLAESVYQVVKGSPAGTAATLDTLAKGQRPPEPEVVAMPRSGTVLHHRVALVLGDGTPAPGWTGTSPRAAAAPELNAWLGRLLGPPDALRCRAAPEGGAPVTVTVLDLHVEPVDLVMLAQAEQGRVELDRRIAWHLTETGPDVAVTIDYDAPAGAVALGAALELAAAAGKLLGFGRPLTAADLLPPELSETAADTMSFELAARTTAARTALATARDELADAAASVTAGGGLTRLRAALVAAAGFGVQGAYPADRHAAEAATGKALLALATSVVAELDRRTAAADAAGGPVDAMQAVFGRDLPVVPRFRPAAPELLASALVAEPLLGDEPGATVEGWFAQLARVRPPLDAWRDVRIMGRALGRAPGRPRIAQLPLAPGAVWAGLQFATEAQRHRSGLVSLALVGELQPPGADRPWAGLLLDSWPEIVPNAEEDAGVVFHFDAPRAEAPQAVLLAVPATPSPHWDYEGLERTLIAAFRLAQIRALDLPGFGQHGQFLPMTFLAANRVNKAVSTSFRGLLRADAVIASDGG